MSSKSKISSCIRCDHVFAVREPLAPRGNWCPHILHCGHAICERCLTSALDIDASVACPQCSRQSLQRQGSKNLNKEFPINLYVLGQFMEKHRNRMPQDSKITFVPPTSPSISRTVSNVSVNVVGVQPPSCHECSQNEAEWSCENCPANYCSSCFAKVHGAARSLKSHIRAPIRSHVSPLCDVHGEQRKDFFCHACNEIICPCCAISSHSGHQVITRAQMNEEQMDNVHAAVLVAGAVLGEITKSQQELQELLAPVGGGKDKAAPSGDAAGPTGGSAGAEDQALALTQAERAVTRHFAFLHGMLQLQEAALLERLAQAAGAAQEGARAALRELAAAGERTRALLVEASRVSAAGQLRWGDLRELTQRLLDTRHERCRLVHSETSAPRYTFSVDSDFTSLLAKHCLLEVVDAVVPTLEPMGNSPPDKPLSTVSCVVAVSNIADLSNAADLSDAVPKEEQCDPEVKSQPHPSNESVVPLEEKDSKETEVATRADEASSLPSQESTLPSACAPSVTIDTIAAAAEAALASCKGETTESSSLSSVVTSPVSNKSDISQNIRVIPRRSARGRPSRHGRGGTVYPPASSCAPVADRPTASSSRLEHSASISFQKPVENTSLPAVTSNFVRFNVSQENPPPKPFVAVGKPEVVQVVHVKNPSSFYVHRDQDKSLLEDIQKFLDVCPEREYLPLTSVTIGQMYICKFLVDDKWYRVIVKNCTAMLNPPESRDAIVDVFYMDYGNCDHVPLSRLRPVPAQLIDVPPYALHCSIFDLYPRNGREGEWPDDAHRTFCKMVNGVRVHMHVMNFKDEVYYIDLCAIPGMKHCNFPVSLRDAMVFMDFAHLEDENRLNVRKSSARFDSEYLKEEPLTKNENFPVVLSHIDNPSQFYAQRRGSHADYLTKLLDDMSQYYKTKKDEMIYDPGVGMPCAAQFSLDKSWYRARVSSIPRKSWVEVFYVDYGNREEIPYTSIRKLPEKFMRIPPQAIECSLADIMPTKGNKWLKAATKFFLSVTKDKELRLLVENVSKSCKKVILYEEKENVDVCLNALLVRERHALSVGVGASLVEYFKVEAAIPPDGIQGSLMQFETIKPTRRKVRKAPKSDPGGVGLLGTNVCVANDDPLRTTVSDVSTKPGPPLSIPVTAVAINSPGSLYVSPCSIEEEIANLIADMQIFYSEMPLTKRQWHQKDKCSVWSEKKEKWYRAVIVEVLDNKVKVFYKDIALTETVDIDNLRELDERFSTLHDGAVRCHMVGIRAAGGQNKWPSITCETLTELAHKVYSELYITKKGEIEDRSLPIELWARDVISPGPLEPNRIEWISLNKILVDKGLAIPTSMPDTLEIFHTSLYALDKDVLKPDVAETNFSEQSRKSMSEDSDSSVSSEEYYDKQELMLFPENPKRQWLSPVPLKKRHFIGLTTNVDSKCLIYLHNVEDNETLAVIREGVTNFIGDSKPKPQDMYWFEGQMCLVQFYLDKWWYRGKIMEVKENNKYEVYFIDYGNTELCDVSMLRKDVIMDYIPTLCRAYRLDEVLPADCDGKWNQDHLDFLHTTLDGKHCKIFVRSSLDDAVPNISIILPGNIDVAQLLVSMHYAIYSSNVFGNEAASETSSVASVIIEKEEMVRLDSSIEMELEVHEKLANSHKVQDPVTKDNDHALENPDRKADDCTEDNTDENSQCSKNNIKKDTVKIEGLNQDMGIGNSCDNSKTDLCCDQIEREELSVNDNVDEKRTKETKEKEVIVRDELKTPQLKCSSTLLTSDSNNTEFIEEGQEITAELDNEVATVDDGFDKSEQIVCSSPFLEVLTRGIKYGDLEDRDLEVTEKIEGSVSDVGELKSFCDKNTVTLNKSIASHSFQLDSGVQSGRIEKQSSENDTHTNELGYKKLCLKNCDSLIVEVTILMDDLREIVMVPIRNKNQEIDCGEEFDIMTSEIQNEAAFQPPITPPYIGQPCCAQYFDDEQYYRATVLEVSEDNAKVRVEFVDYGNVEWIDIKSVHQIKTAWMNIPKQNIKCHLWNIKIAEHCERKSGIKGMSQLIFNQPLTAKIRQRNPLAVELYQCNTTMLVYQPLLETGLFVQVHPTEGEKFQELHEEKIINVAMEPL